MLVTHDRGEAMALGDRVGVLMDGRLLQVDEAAQVFRAPATEEIARFVGVETILDCRVVRRGGVSRCSTPAGRRIEVAQAAAPGEWVRLCLRAEDVTLFPGAPRPAASRALIASPGRVLRIVRRRRLCARHRRLRIPAGGPRDAAVRRGDGAPRRRARHRPLQGDGAAPDRDTASLDSRATAGV